MKIRSLIRRFFVRGVYWRRFMHWGAVALPFYVEPLALLVWTFIFYGALIRQRRAALCNLEAIVPDSTILGRHARAFRMFYTFACTITDTARFKELEDPVDWEFEGLPHFDRLVSTPEGAIILTAHMGNYDLGSYIFARRMKDRQLTIVRAPEVDPQTQEFESVAREKMSTDTFRVDYNVNPELLAVDLVHALRKNHIVAIQGDRVTHNVTAFKTEIFGRPAAVPLGPFALALATEALIYPLFVLRVGWKRYRVLTCAPIQCRRTGRDRNKDIERAVEKWISVLQNVIRTQPHQWFMFERFDEERA